MKSSNIVIIILLISIVALLSALLFKDKISWYFKSQEILDRSNMLYVFDVAEACYDFVMDEDSFPSDHCSKVWDGYLSTEERWISLIKERRDLDCTDFVSKRDASEFYQYINGEFSLAAFEYARKEEKEGAERHRKLTIVSNEAVLCRYDPYGLDEDSDCNACENYGQ